MDELKTISEIEFNDIVARTGFNKDKLKKDYYLTLILYLIKDVKGIYFKGGTALNKIFLNHARLSEDIDFSLTRNENLLVEWGLEHQNFLFLELIKYQYHYPH